MKQFSVLFLSLVTSTLVAGSAYPLLAQEQSAAQLLKVTPRGSLRYNSNGAGFDSYVHFEGFLPLTQQPGKNLTFLDGRLLLAPDNGTLSGNVLLAHRFFSNNNQVLGGYLAYDRRNTGDAKFNQIGFGLERLTANLDLRLNAYFPVGETRSLVASRSSAAAQFVGNNLVFDRRQDFQVALRGVDLEAGVPLLPLGSGFVWGYVGAYYYRGDDFPGFAGARGRLVARPQENVEVNLTVQSDSEFGTRAWVGLGLTYPAQPATRQANNTVNLAARIAEPIERLVSVVVTEQTVVKQEVAINPLTGQPYRFIFVDTGAGSFSDLSSVQLAEGDIVLVGIIDPVTGAANTNAAGTGNVVLTNGTQLLSSTVLQQVNTGFGLVSVPALTPSTTAPTLQGTVILANNNVVNGLNIQPAGAIGIQGTNISNANLQNNRISGASTGILLQNVTNPILSNNTVLNAANRGISLTQTTNAQLVQNVVDGAVGEGIGLDNALGTVVIDRNIVRNVTQTATDTNLEAGIFIRNNTGNANITISNNITESYLQSANRVDGIEVNLCRGDSFDPVDRFSDNAFATCTAPASMTVNVANNQIRSIGTGTDGSDGIDFNLGDGGNLVATVQGNQVESISGAGISVDIASSAAPIAAPVMNMTIANNQIRNILNDDAIRAESNTAGSVALTIRDNTIDTVGGNNDGIDLEFTTTATNPTKTVVTIANNQILNVSDRGVEIDTTNNALLQISVTNNTITSTPTSTGTNLRLAAAGTSNLFATVTGNTFSQLNSQFPVANFIPIVGGSARLCLNAVSNLGSLGSGIDLRQGGTGVLQVVNLASLGADNNNISVTQLTGTPINIPPATFEAATPTGCTPP